MMLHSSKCYHFCLIGVSETLLLLDTWAPLQQSSCGLLPHTVQSPQALAGRKSMQQRHKTLLYAFAAGMESTSGPAMTAKCSGQASQVGVPHHGVSAQLVPSSGKHRCCRPIWASCSWHQQSQHWQPLLSWACASTSQARRKLSQQLCRAGAQPSCGQGECCSIMQLWMLVQV